MEQAVAFGDPTGEIQEAGRRVLGGNGPDPWLSTRKLDAFPFPPEKKNTVLCLKW